MRDSFQNFLLGQGQGADNALSFSTYGFNPITRNRTLLEWMYRGSWVCGQAVDIKAEDMTRKGVDWLGFSDPEASTALQREWDVAQTWTGLGESLAWGDLYGGSIGVIMVDGEDAAVPLREDAVRAGSYRGVLPLDRWFVEADLTRLVGDLGPDVGTPQFYRVQADAPVLRSQIIHHSRVVRFEGVRLPYWQRVSENLWGMSVLERLYDRLVAFDSATTGAAQLVYKSFLRTYKVKNLRNLLAEGGDAVEVLLRFTDLMRRTQHLEGVTLIDAEDDMVVQQANVQAGISDALSQLGHQICGALTIPAVRFFGQSPAGMSATGESDFRNYYDGVHQRQERKLRPGVDRVARVAAASAGLTLDEGFGFTFRSLWEMDDKDKAQIASQDTDSVLKVSDAGLMDEAAILTELRERGRAVGRWSSITDEMIETVEREGPPRLNINAPPEGGVPGEEGGEDGTEPAPLGARRPRLVSSGE